jgi:general secretion pathway protein J
MRAAALPHSLRRDAGFTLAEMLVSLFLFGLISALIASVVDLITRLDGSIRQRGESIDQIVSAQTMLRARLEQIRPTVDIHGLGDTISMIGTSDEFNFTAPGFAAEGRHGTQVMRLRRTNQGRLVLYSAPQLGGYDMRVASVEGWSAVPLLDRVQTLQITYFGADKRTGRDVWQERWIDRAQPPKLVRIRVGFAENDARTWPVLLVRPLSGLRLACQDGRKSADCGDES